MTVIVAYLVADIEMVDGVRDFVISWKAEGPEIPNQGGLGLRDCSLTGQ